MPVLTKKRSGYDCEDEYREIVPAKAQPARGYIWYHHMHRPSMIAQSREEGKAHYCMVHPDGRCTKGWEFKEVSVAAEAYRYITAHRWREGTLFVDSRCPTCGKEGTSLIDLAGDEYDEMIAKLLRVLDSDGTNHFCDDCRAWMDKQEAQIGRRIT